MVNMRIEGEDLCVCWGVAESENPGFVLKQIIESRATCVILLSEADPEERRYLEEFGRDLKAMMESSGVHHFQIGLYSVEEWNRVYKQNQNVVFGIIHCGVDFPSECLSYQDELALKKGKAREWETYQKIGAFAELEETFGDLPLVWEDLKRIVYSFVHYDGKGLPPTAVLLGDTGTGKSFVAKKIAEIVVEARKKNRVPVGEKEARFRQINCGRLGKDTIGAELFGVPQRRFTGVEACDGAIKAVGRGVVFLDEIGTLDVDLQTQLLTPLDDGRYSLYGDQSSELLQSECCFLFGTNVDLQSVASNSEKFRYDLFCRMRRDGVVRLPSLRERVESGTHGKAFLTRLVARQSQEQGLCPTNAVRDVISQFLRKQKLPGNYRDVQRFFANLKDAVVRSKRPIRMVEEGKSVVPMKELEDVIEKWLSTGEEVPESQGAVGIDSSLIDQAVGLTADEECRLRFALECAASAKNANQAAQKFRAVRNGRQTANPRKVFVHFLESVGLKWDDAATGHVSRVIEDAKAQA